MLHWAWGLAKRHPTAALCVTSVVLLAGAFVHLLLTAFSAPSTLGTLGITADMAAAIAAFVLWIWAAWRAFLEKP